MSRTSVIGGLIIATGLGFAAFWYLAPREASFGMFEGSGGVKLERIAISFGATIAGVMLGSFYRALRRLRDLGIDTIDDFSLFFSRAFRAIDLWMGLVAAPMVYALILQSTDGMSLPGLILVALQNGFCVLLVANAFLGRAETQVADGSPVGVNDLTQNKRP